MPIPNEGWTYFSAIRCNGSISIECVREDNLLGLRVYAQTLILGADLLQLVDIVTGVYAQSLEQIGEVLGEIE